MITGDINSPDTKAAITRLENNFKKYEANVGTVDGVIDGQFDAALRKQVLVFQDMLKKTHPQLSANPGVYTPELGAAIVQHIQGKLANPAIPDNVGGNALLWGMLEAEDIAENMQDPKTFRAFAKDLPGIVSDLDALHKNNLLTPQGRATATLVTTASATTTAIPSSLARPNPNTPAPNPVFTITPTPSVRVPFRPGYEENKPAASAVASAPAATTGGATPEQQGPPEPSASSDSGLTPVQRSINFIEAILEQAATSGAVEGMPRPGIISERAGGNVFDTESEDSLAFLLSRVKAGLAMEKKYDGPLDGTYSETIGKRILDSLEGLPDDHAMVKRIPGGKATAKALIDHLNRLNEEKVLNNDRAARTVFDSQQLMIARFASALPDSIKQWLVGFLDKLGPVGQMIATFAEQMGFPIRQFLQPGNTPDPSKTPLQSYAEIYTNSLNKHGGDPEALKLEVMDSVGKFATTMAVYGKLEDGSFGGAIKSLFSSTEKEAFLSITEKALDAAKASNNSPQVFAQVLDDGIKAHLAQTNRTSPEQPLGSDVDADAALTPRPADAAASTPSTTAAATNTPASASTTTPTATPAATTPAPTGPVVTIDYAAVFNGAFRATGDARKRDDMKGHARDAMDAVFAEAKVGLTDEQRSKLHALTSKAIDNSLNGAPVDFSANFTKTMREGMGGLNLGITIKDVTPAEDERQAAMGGGRLRRDVYGRFTQGPSVLRDQYFQNMETPEQTGLNAQAREAAQIYDAGLKSGHIKQGDPLVYDLGNRAAIITRPSTDGGIEQRVAILDRPYYYAGMDGGLNKEFSNIMLAVRNPQGELVRDAQGNITINTILQFRKDETTQMISRGPDGMIAAQRLQSEYQQARHEARQAHVNNQGQIVQGQAPRTLRSAGDQPFNAALYARQFGQLRAENMENARVSHTAAELRRHFTGDFQQLGGNNRVLRGLFGNIYQDGIDYVADRQRPGSSYDPGLLYGTNSRIGSQFSSANRSGYGYSDNFNSRSSGVPNPRFAENATYLSDTYISSRGHSPLGAIFGRTTSGIKVYAGNEISSAIGNNRLAQMFVIPAVQEWSHPKGGGYSTGIPMLFDFIKGIQ